MKKRERRCSSNLVSSSRVFLRAINKFAETMNQKFLEHTSFEFQVGVKCWRCSGPSWHQQADYTISHLQAHRSLAEVSGDVQKGSGEGGGDALKL